MVLSAALQQKIHLEPFSSGTRSRLVRDLCDQEEIEIYTPVSRRTDIVINKNSVAVKKTPVYLSSLNNIPRLKLLKRINNYFRTHHLVYYRGIYWPRKYLEFITQKETIFKPFNPLFMQISPFSLFIFLTLP